MRFAYEDPLLMRCISRTVATLYGYRCYAKTAFTPRHFSKEDTTAFKRAQYEARKIVLVDKKPDVLELHKEQEEAALRELEKYPQAYVRNRKAKLLYDYYSYAERIKHGLI